MDLALWRRALIIALKFDLPNKEKVFERLAKEPLDTAVLMGRYFGQDNANRYIEIMYQRIYNYRSMVEAMIRGDTVETEDNFQKLNELADRLADFFYDLSPVYPREEWSQLFRQYEQLMHDQAEAVVTGNHDAEIGLSDRIIDQITLITEHVARVIAVALGWSSANTMTYPEVRVTTAIWRFPGR